MAIIAQKSLFDYSEIENLGDLERLVLVFEGVDDEALMQRLESKRKHGRNDYPIRVLWNLLLAMLVFGHKSVASFRRELARNAQLRRMCGLHDGEGRRHLVPPARVFSGFLRALQQEQAEVDRIFTQQVGKLYEKLPGFGAVLAGDGKYIESVARRKPAQDQTSTDQRSENDAEWSVKEYHYTDAQGKKQVKKEYHFGFKGHFICDVETELPVAYQVTAANADERKEMQQMLERFLAEQRAARDNAEALLLDRGYDSLEMIQTIKREGIAPVVDIRNCWRNGEKTKQYKDTNMVYDFQGNVYYVEENGEMVKMKYEGYDRQKKCLRYSHRGKVYRLYLSYDERVFVPIARDSAKFLKLYKGRTAIERFNGRLDRDYMFEDHYIRGLSKMTLMVSLSLIVMNGMALGKLKAQRKGLRSLTTAA